VTGQHQYSATATAMAGLVIEAIGV